MSFVPASLFEAGLESKPGGRLYLNKKHPMARHIDKCLVPVRGGWLDLVTGTHKSTSGSGALIGKADGQGIATADMGSSITFPTNVGAAPGYSFGVVMWPDTVTGDAEVFKLQETAAKAITFRARHTQDFSQFRTFDGGAKTLDDSAVTSGVRTGAFRYVSTLTSYAANDHVMDSNGVQCDSSTATYNYANLAIVEILLGATSNNTGPSQLCVLWNRALTPLEREAWGKRPYAPFGIPLFTRNFLGFPLSVGGGVITGTGAITLGAVTVSGTANRGLTANGAVTLPAAIIAGTAERELTASGALSLAATTISGTGAVGPVVSGSGAITIAATTIAGAAERVLTASGDVSMPAVAVSGSAGRALDGTGSISIAGVTVAGTSERAITASGAVTFGSVTIAGTAAIGALITGRTVYMGVSANQSDLNQGPNITADLP